MENSEYQKSSLFQKPSNFKRNITVLILFIILTSVIVIVEYFIRQDLVSNTKTEIPTPTPTSIPKNESDSHVVAWSDTAENIPLTDPKKPIFDSKKQDTLVRVRGTLNKIINSSKNYEVNLSSGEVITVLITPETYIGKAQFGQDKNGSIAAINYLPISKDTLYTLQVGQTISLSYYQKNYISDSEEIVLDEFVLF